MIEWSEEGKLKEKNSAQRMCYWNTLKKTHILFKVNGVIVFVGVYLSKYAFILHHSRSHCT